MISSDMEEILHLSDRVAVMHEGRVTGVLERADCTEQRIMALAVARSGRLIAQFGRGGIAPMRAAPGELPSKTWASRPVSSAYRRAMSRTVLARASVGQHRHGAATSAAGDLGAVDTTGLAGLARQRDQPVGSLRPEPAR